MTSTGSAPRLASTDRIELLDLAPDTDTLLADVLAGLAQQPRTLPCKYFYDARGAALFEQICELPEYYPTRTEIAILQDNLPAIATAIGPGCAVIEPGSGSGIKTRLLLEALQAPAAYVPIDVARQQLLNYADDLAATYPDLELLPVCADFTMAFELPAAVRSNPQRLIYFPGSTIGNFKPQAAMALLQRWRTLLGNGGSLLIGVDLKKDPAVIEAAYNDAQGITAAFNLNLLHRLNRQLGANFQVDQFLHHADYDPASGAVRMWLTSQQQQRVEIDSQSIDFAAGEAICTEHSHKYDPDGFTAMAADAGWEKTAQWTDAEQLFSVMLFKTC